MTATLDTATELPHLLPHDILLALEDRVTQAYRHKEAVAEQLADAYAQEYLTEDEEAQLECYRMATIARYAEASDCLAVVRALIAPPTTEPF